MVVSAGFYKKIEQWVLDAQSEKIAFQPFQANGNPYKANIFIIGATPEPYLQLGSDDLEIYANSLVDQNEFQKLFYEEIVTASREYKGCINFMEWMKENFNETVVLAHLNSLYAESLEQFKKLKKNKDPLYDRGLELLSELLNEFAPKIVIVQGAANWKQFLEQYGEQLNEVMDIKLPVQQLESKGVVAKLSTANGDVVNIIVCRSMGSFGKTGASFGELKQTLNKLLQN